MRTSSQILPISDEITDRVRQECPELKWLANYAIVGPYD